MSTTPFLGGALKLKGDSATIGKKIKKKKKEKPPAADEETEQQQRQQQRAAPDDDDDDAAAEAAAGTSAAAAAATAAPDRRTEAERRRDAQLARVEGERLRRAAEGKGYRERVAEYNDRLAALSEHHDIPRVGPG